MSLHSYRLYGQTDAEINIRDYEDSLKAADEVEKLKWYVELAWEYRTYNPQKGLEYAGTGLKLAMILGSSKYEATLLNVQGVINTYLGSYDLALGQHLTALSIRENNNDTLAIAASLNNIGLIYERTQDFEKALQYYQQALRIKESLNDKLSIAISLNNVGFTLRKLKRYDESLKYLLSALKLNEEINNKSGLALTYSNLGIIYKEKHSHINALEYSIRSLKLREEIGDSQGIAIQLYFIAAIKVELKHYQSAEEYFFKSINISKQNLYRPILMDNYYAVSELYEKQYNFEGALRYFKMYAGLRDSILSDDRTKKLIELEKKYETEKNHLKIQSLELERETTIRNFLIAIISLGVISLLVIINRYRANIKTNRILKESEEFNRALLADLPEYVLIHVDGNIVYTNKIVSDVFGYTDDELKSMHIQQLVDDESYQKILQKRDRGQSANNAGDYEINAITRNGEIRILRVQEQSIQYTNKQAILTVLNDITVTKKFQQELIDAKEHAEKSDKLKTEFLAQISHEIRTPLHVLLSWAELLQSEIRSKLPKDMETGFDVIREQGSRTIRTIDLILNMSELQLGTYQPIFRECDINKEILGKLHKELSYHTEKKNLKFELITESTDNKVAIDEYSMYQTFRNLLENAIKYTPSGKITIKIFRDSLNKINVSIADTGIGISEDYLPNLFTPFSQEEQGYTRRFEGNGLGLSLVKKYIELNRANIQVKSKKGSGSEFKVIFESTPDSSFP